jgi:hypothetical protein
MAIYVGQRPLPTHTGLEIIRQLTSMYSDLILGVKLGGLQEGETCEERTAAATH